MIAPFLIAVPAGAYMVGEAGHLLNPRRSVTVRAFEIAITETTNREFAEFVAATGYTTDAERLHNAMVFEPGLKEFRWIQDPSAFWRWPNGKTRGGIADKMDHPVTTISFRDALAYCRWAKLRLPSLVEWEIASRAGAKGRQFFDRPDQIGQYANIWHGRDHMKPDVSDGWLRTAPVASFAPNPWGLYDMYGNVFELCADQLPSDVRASSRHSRGGSWWCSRNSCSFFNSVDIGTVNWAASFSNQGFRVAR